MLEGKTVSALLVELEEQSQMYYRLHQLSIDPGPDICWFDVLANAAGPKSVDVLVDGARKIVPQSPGGCTSEISLRHGHRPCAEISLRAGDLPLHAFISNLREW
jgi:hypothetical protein